MTSAIVVLIAVVAFTLSLCSTSVLASISNSLPSESNSCISFDSSERIISITCKTSTLTDIYNQINDKNILDRETPDGVWLLNAGIVIEHDAKLVIDEEDTKWLKMFAGETSSDSGDDTNGDREDGDGSVYAIRVHGSLNIDSVKITSWDPAVNGYIRFEYDILPGREYEHTGIDAIPRPYIRVEDDATGTTNITNSEIAYLGYECGGGCSGISYYEDSGDDNDGNIVVANGTGALQQQGTSILKGNHIHHNRFGFYSVGMGNMVLEDNHVHHNFMYGFDPHTGTHDMIIRNNTVHDHGAMGIICSLDCYNVLIENNTVSNSAGSGIMFSRNMTNSIARNNYVHNEKQCIFVSQSHDTKVYNNTVDNCGNGIYLKHDSSNNSIFDNTIQNVNDSAILLNDGASDNSVYSNIIVNPSFEEEAINNEDQDNNTFEDNKVLTNTTFLNF
ncbi:MAG: right-handed parallel beta-helix repeat-containing protein [Nitrososphaeraceae archaeon]